MADYRCKILYVLLFIVLVLVLIYLFIRWRLQSERLQLAGKKEEMNQEHINFMTNISHELRTPLSLIYAPLKLLKNKSFPEEVQGLLSTIEQNTDRLLSLSGQILESGKKQDRTERLHVCLTDITAVVQRIVRNIRYAAIEKDITISTQMQEGMKGYIDYEIIEKILSNLLSNALKYTPEHGKVQVSALLKNDLLILCVCDNGIGVPPPKRERLFERFDRLDVQNRNPQLQGSGVGLNYSRELAQLHKGSLEYAPVQEGGSAFTLTRPCTKESFTAKEIGENTAYYLQAVTDETSLARTQQMHENNLLLVEDDPQIRSFLQYFLGNYFNVMVAADGMEALERLKMAIPDVVLSDVMMPHKDGFSLCKDIK